mgnify:CR=1 FL=1
MQNFSIDDLFDFLNKGVSAFHSTAAAAAILEANGYQNCPESAAWDLVPGGKYLKLVRIDHDVICLYAALLLPQPLASSEE